MNHLKLVSILALGLAACSIASADIRVGQDAPDFSVQDQNGKVRTLADFKGKTLVLAFYPKDFTGG